MNRTSMALWLTAALVAGPVAAQPSAPAKPAAAKKATRNELGAQLVLTTDAATFVKAWNDAQGRQPELETTDSVARGGSLSAMLIFNGCAADKTGKCDLVADFALVTPDGKTLPLATGTVWNDAVPGGRIQLGKRSATLRFDANDVAGHYTIKANLIDRNAKRTVSLSAPFNVL